VSGDHRGPDDLPSTAWTVLGLLSFGRALSGYDVKKWADSSLGFFYWSPAPSQIYSELRRLERHGYAMSSAPPDADARNRRVYEITDAGRDALGQWVRTAPEPTVLKHAAMLRIWLGHLTSPAELGVVVDGHRAELTAQLAAASHAAERARADASWRYPAVVTRWVVRRIEAELSLLDDLEADLADARPVERARRA
jgi:DNA-binding PadR family transcriptional regulator